jgi:hypothetical protein
MVALALVPVEDAQAKAMAMGVGFLEVAPMAVDQVYLGRWISFRKSPPSSAAVAATGRFSLK